MFYFKFIKDIKNVPFSHLTWRIFSLHTYPKEYTLCILNIMNVLFAFVPKNILFAYLSCRIYSLHTYSEEYTLCIPNMKYVLFAFVPKIYSLHTYPEEYNLSIPIPNLVSARKKTGKILWPDFYLLYKFNNHV